MRLSALLAASLFAAACGNYVYPRQSGDDGGTSDGGVADAGGDAGADAGPADGGNKGDGGPVSGNAAGLVVLAVAPYGIEASAVLLDPYVAHAAKLPPLEGCVVETVANAPQNPLRPLIAPLLGLPDGTAHKGGGVSVTGLANTGQMNLLWDSNRKQWVSPQNTPGPDALAANSTLTIMGQAASDFPAFSVQAVAPERFILGSPSGTFQNPTIVDTTQSLVFAWTGTVPNATVFLGLGVGNVLVRCRANDDGSYTIGPGTLGQLPKGQYGFAATARIARVDAAQGGLDDVVTDVGFAATAIVQTK